MSIAQMCYQLQKCSNLQITLNTLHWYKNKYSTKLEIWYMFIILADLALFYITANS